MPNPCKTPGCPHSANTRYDRGIFARLCEEVCIPARREQASSANRRDQSAKPLQEWTPDLILAALQRSARELGRTPKTSDWEHMTPEHPSFNQVYKFFPGWAAAIEAAGLKPTKRTASKPAEPAPPADPVGEHPSFAEVAETLEAARDAVEEADRTFAEALDDFKAHPLFKEIEREVGWS